MLMVGDRGARKDATEEELDWREDETTGPVLEVFKNSFGESWDAATLMGDSLPDTGRGGGFVEADLGMPAARMLLEGAETSLAGASTLADERLLWRRDSEREDNEATDPKEPTRGSNVRRRWGRSEVVGAGIALRKLLGRLVERKITGFSADSDELGRGTGREGDKLTIVEEFASPVPRSAALSLVCSGSCCRF
jgi:hypothetical protein